MEKRTAESNTPLIRVAITGPECTGKTILTDQLSGYYHAKGIPEFARDYVAGLNRHYTYQDVEHIARVQRNQVRDIENQGVRLLFIDTYLVVTKIWFEVVYHQVPQWIEEELHRKQVDLFLLCSTDIPWTPDPVRENGGEMREVLFSMYKDELERLGSRYVIIVGSEEQRLKNAVNAINAFLQEIGQQELIK
ncbi:MAG: ATP-binding protein [Bacteroidales bacterium]|nr:ATP-binding protein [Bacteroidales bacterium]